MRFAGSAKVREVLRGILQPGQGTAAMEGRVGQAIRQMVATGLCALIILVPMGQGTAFAQQAAPANNAQPWTPLSPDQLDQLVAPIALYPDALVAQVLAGATYPQQIPDADRWRELDGRRPDRASMSSDH